MFALVLGGVSLLTGCKGNVIEKIDPNRTQIYVSVYDGGYGTDWLTQIKQQFENDNPKYQVIITPGQGADITEYSSSLNYNIYFTTTSPSFKQLVAKNLVADISDLYESPLKNSGETKPLKEKVLQYDLVKQAYSYPGKTGIYGLPYTSSVGGFVYDHGIFKENIENGWLWTATAADEEAVKAQGISCHVQGEYLIFDSATKRTNYTAGDIILRAGKDGVYGTYDDGQPETLAEWKILFTRINQTSTAVPVVYSESFGYEYTLPVLKAIFAQYEGLKNNEIFYTYTGEYNGRQITPQTGNLVYEMEGLQQALDFYEYSIVSKDNARIPAQSDHRGAQNDFLLWDQRSNADKKGAMLVEGIWWEYEARTMFDSLENTGNSNYKYGTRDYRYMLFPEIPGQKGIDGEGNGTVMAVQDSGTVLIANKGDQNFIDMCKLFVSYTLRDENLKQFTLSTGTPKPYKYSLSDEELAKMTKFQRSVWDMYQDSENIYILNTTLLDYTAPISFSTKLGSSRFTAYVNEEAGRGTYNYPVEMRVRNISKETWLEGMKWYARENWAGYYETSKPLYEVK